MSQVYLILLPDGTHKAYELAHMVAQSELCPAVGCPADELAVRAAVIAEMTARRIWAVHKRQNRAKSPPVKGGDFALDEETVVREMKKSISREKMPLFRHVFAYCARHEERWVRTAWDGGEASGQIAFQTALVAVCVIKAIASTSLYTLEDRKQDWHLRRCTEAAELARKMVQRIALPGVDPIAFRVSRAAIGTSKLLIVSENLLQMKPWMTPLGRDAYARLMSCREEWVEFVRERVGASVPSGEIGTVTPRLPPIEPSAESDESAIRAAHEEIYLYELKSRLLG